MGAKVPAADERAVTVAVARAAQPADEADGRLRARRLSASSLPACHRLMSAKKYTGATEFGKPCRNLLHGLLFKRIDQWQAGVDNPAGRRPAQAGQAAAADPPIFLASPPRRKSEVEREFAAVECLMVAVAT